MLFVIYLSLYVMCRTFATDLEKGQMDHAPTPGSAAMVTKCLLYMDDVNILCTELFSC